MPYYTSIYTHNTTPWHPKQNSIKSKTHFRFDGDASQNQNVPSKAQDIKTAIKGNLQKPRRRRWRPPELRRADQSLPLRRCPSAIIQSLPRSSLHRFWQRRIHWWEGFRTAHWLCRETPIHRHLIFLDFYFCFHFLFETHCCVLFKLLYIIKINC